MVAIAWRNSGAEIRANRDPILATKPCFYTNYSRANILASSGSVQPYQHLYGYINPLPFALGYGIFNNNSCGCCGTTWFQQPMHQPTFGNPTLFGIQWNETDSYQCQTEAPQVSLGMSTGLTQNQNIFQINWDKTGTQSNCNCNPCQNNKLDMIS